MQPAEYIFISDANISVLGSLPYLYKTGRLRSATIFATSPVGKLGAQSLFEFVI